MALYSGSTSSPYRLISCHSYEVRLDAKSGTIVSTGSQTANIKADVEPDGTAITATSKPLFNFKRCWHFPHF